jgi:putative ABC transport system permease protein
VPEGAGASGRPRQSGGIVSEADGITLDPRRPVFDTVWHDIRHAARSLRRTPAFTAAALATLALGIGANTAIFSLVNAVMLRGLAVAEPEQLVFIGHRNPRDADGTVNLISNPAWLQRVRQETGVFAGVGAYNVRDFKVASTGGVEQVVGQYATGNYHALVGVPFALGRGFANESDFAAGASPIAVISDRYWQRRYQRSPDVLGREIVVGGHTLTIVGVTAAGFDGMQPGRAIDITLPLSIRVQDEPTFVDAVDSWTNMPLVARLKPGITAGAAEPVVNAAYIEHMARPGIGFGRGRDGTFVLTAAVVPAARGADRLRRDHAPALRVLAAIVAVVLLIACINIANLFLARNEARADEISMRLAIGASRTRIVRQLLTEGGMVAIGGGLIGFAAAASATRYLSTLLAQGQRPISIDVQPDARVFAFTLAVTAVATVLFGFVPALRATRCDGPRRSTRIGATTPRRSGGRLALVGAQFAMCVVLVFGAGLLVRTLRNLHAVDTRFDAGDVVAFAIDANDTAFPLDRMNGLCAQTVARLTLPGIAATSCSTMTPLDTAREVRTLGVPELPPGRESRDVLANAVSPGYFATFAIDLTRGRLFTDADSGAAPRVAILNEAAARRFFGDQNPLGRQIAFGSRPRPGQELTVVGIVGDIRQQLREETEPMVYQPLAQLPDGPDYLIGALRTSADLSTVAARIRAVVSDISAEPAVAWVRTLRQQMDAALVTERLLVRLSVAFGLLSLVLAGIGVYGVIAYDVARRTREFGIRFALGAQRRMVVNSVLRQTAVVIVPGMMSGLAGAMIASGLVETFLFGITPRDPSTLATTAAVLAATALIAAYVPARRATFVNPARALRAE